MNSAQSYYRTISMCPFCESLLPGEVVAKGNQVLITRECPDHGKLEGLICSDREWYEGLPRFDVSPVKPATTQTSKDRGCPQDCGLCPAHRQIAGTAAIEVSNVCNSSCPVCLGDNRGTFELSVREVETLVQELLERQKVVDALTISGGEPTIHPHLFEIIRVLERPGIRRIVLNTNGIRIAEDDTFLDELAKHQSVYVSLHLDGASAMTLRGVSPEVQEKALNRLCRWKINTAPLILAARGANEHELGRLTLRLLTQSPAIKSVFLSLMASCGERGSRFPWNPLTRLTIPAALSAMESDTQGKLKKRDFIPLPMPNPLCAAIGYYLVDGENVFPLIPLGEMDQILAHIQNAHFVRPEHGMEEFLKRTIDSLYADPSRHENAEETLAAFKRLHAGMFQRGIGEEERYRIAEERIKTVYLMQFMDKWTFDSVRLSKCSCQHLLPDHRVVPSCGYYTYHRRLDPRFA